MTIPTDLNALNSQLDEEIKKVTRLEKEFRAWADQQREKFNDIRKNSLNEGDISISEFHQIVSALNGIASASDETKAYLINTFQLLCP
ncbi:hypothetical protein M9Y10_008352 [Tritrichomonas musculus]|uniref:Uncharacterized protein n=1 Tax=Tritrichomonas musculus TaxID=1915356 RepID=A0ABR2IXZ9_9EUKA